jgi:hypothetical protein
VTDRFGGPNVTVPLGPCGCPSTPHADGDEAYLLPRLTFAGGAAGEALIGSALTKGDEEAIASALVQVYIRHQVTGWNLTGEDGAPVPWDPDLLLSDWTMSRVVGEAADDLYSEALLAPLLASVSKSSQGGQTAPSTSPRTRSASTRRKR